MAYGALIVKLQASLTTAKRGTAAPTPVVSAAVGDAKNGLASPRSVQSAPAGQAMLYDMGTYTQSNVGFSEELLSGLDLIKRAHLVVGLSASTISWKTPPTDADLAQRFN